MPLGTLGTATATVNYTYSDSAWKDLLTGYNGQTISSDAIGNMVSDGTWTYTWEHGRELATMSNGTTTWTYTYNADGLRTSRSSGTTTYSYIYNGSKLSQMTVGEDTLYFTYDASAPMSVTYNSTTYYYVTNLQGDVIAILNSEGQAVVTYTYDAWGNHLSTDGTMASTLGTLNPLRYRGYVYDQETGLYYLQSRYYDPKVGRFLNTDMHIAAGQGVFDNNVFAYCGNNPIIRVDIAGEAWETVLDVISLASSFCDVLEDSSDIGAWIGFILDLVDLIPFLTGVGEVYKSYRIADNVVDGFGDLSKAKKYGIEGYNSLRKALKGTNLEAHHIIEKRLARHLDIDINNMLSVAVTKEEHQAFTNAWRAAIPYGTDYSKLTREDIWSVAQDIYEGYPEILKAAKEILFD